MNSWKTLLVLSLFILCNACNRNLWHPEYTHDADLEQQLKEIYENDRIPGFYVSLVNADGVLFEKSFGYADIESKSPYTKSTIQNIASISKTFIGIALMQIMEEGKLSLDTPINDILPFKVVNPNHKDIPITIHHLACHTSSINDEDIENRSIFLKEKLHYDKNEIGKENYASFIEYGKNTIEPLSEFLFDALNVDGKFYEKIRFLKDAPGSKHQYSNLGASLLAYVIEIVVGQSYDEYVMSNIIQPLSLNSTYWDKVDNNNPNLATNYFENQLVVPDYQSILYPSGGMYSCPHDLNLFIMEIIKNYKGLQTRLPIPNFQQMISPQLSAEQTSDPIAYNRGLIWAIREQQIGHNGGNSGVILMMAYDKEKDCALLFMTNISLYMHQKIIPQIVEIRNLLNKEIDRLSK